MGILDRIKGSVAAGREEVKQENYYRKLKQQREIENAKANPNRFAKAVGRAAEHLAPVEKTVEKKLREISKTTNTTKKNVKKSTTKGKKLTRVEPVRDPFGLGGGGSSRDAFGLGGSGGKKKDPFFGR